MNHCPKLLSSQIGFDVAQTLLDGFDRHYRIFRDAAIRAKALFEAADWHGLQALARKFVAWSLDYDAVLTPALAMPQSQLHGP